MYLSNPLRATRIASKGLRCTSNGRYSRNVTGDCCPWSLTCFKPWHRPSPPVDQHWLLDRAQIRDLRIDSRSSLLWSASVTDNFDNLDNLRAWEQEKEWEQPYLVGSKGY